MKKYTILLLFVLLYIPAYAYTNYYIDTTNWEVSDFVVNPLYPFYPSAEFGTVPFYFHGIDFLDSQNGIASLTCLDSAVDHNAFIMTHDGGKTWKLTWKNYTDFAGSLNDLKYIDTNLIIAVASSPLDNHNFIITSNNNGNSWTYKLLPNHQYSMDNYGKDFIVIISSDTAYISTDKAENWAKVGFQKPSKAIFESLCIIKPDNIIIIYYDSLYNDLIYHSYDSLKNITYFGTFNQPHKLTGSFTFANTNKGWCATSDTTLGLQNGHFDYIYYTEDGGKTWTQQYEKQHLPAWSTFSNCGFQILCYDSLNVVAWGDCNRIARTTDGGKTWKELIEYPDSVSVKNMRYLNFQRLTFVNRYKFFLYDNDHRIIVGSKPDFLGVEDEEPIQNINTENALIYPNPVREYFKIQNGEGKKIEVYSPEGLLMINTIYFSPIDMSHFSAGMYFIKIDNKMYKIVKV